MVVCNSRILKWVEDYLAENGLTDTVKLLKIYDMSLPRAAAHHTCHMAPVRTLCSSRVVSLLTSHRLLISHKQLVKGACGLQHPPPTPGNWIKPKFEERGGGYFFLLPGILFSEGRQPRFLRGLRFPTTGLPILFPLQQANWTKKRRVRYCSPRPPLNKCNALRDDVFSQHK